MKIPYVFFGSATFSLYVLDELEKAGFAPSIIVTTPDKPSGRGLALTATAVKAWGQKRGIPVLDPARLDGDFIGKLKEKIGQENDAGGTIACFVVAAYGKIIPRAVLDASPRGILNVHPSLLPRYRGATPLQSAMLDDAKKTGVTVMRIDALMDHGPLVAQKEITVDEWPVYETFEETMAREGGKLLARILPGWIAGTIAEKEQDHAAATYTKKIVKEDGRLDMADIAGATSAQAYEIFRKIQAYHRWPTAYFFSENKTGGQKTIQQDRAKLDFAKSPGDRPAEAKKMRVKITQASWHDNRLAIEKVLPEGKKETDFASFVSRSN